MLSHFGQSLLVGGIVGGTAAYLGSLMITRRMALVGDALGHVALPGMGIALLLGLDPSLGALVFLAIGILLIWKLGEITLLSTEALVGIVFVSALALGFLIVPSPDLLESLIGDLSQITPAGTIAAIAVSLVVLLIVRRIYAGMMLLNISEELARVEGISSRKYGLLYLMAIALIVSVGVKITGSLLVGALVIVPPAAARVLCNELKRYAWTSFALGSLSSVIGVILAELTGMHPGPTVILTSSFLFVAAIAFRKFSRSQR